MHGINVVLMLVRCTNTFAQHLSVSVLVTGKYTGHNESYISIWLPSYK